MTVLRMVPPFVTVHTFCASRALFSNNNYGIFVRFMTT